MQWWKNNRTYVCVDIQWYIYTHSVCAYIEYEANKQTNKKKRQHTNANIRKGKERTKETNNKKGKIMAVQLSIWVMKNNNNKTHRSVRLRS